MNGYKLLYNCIDYSVKKEKVDETVDEKQVFARENYLNIFNMVRNDVTESSSF